MPPKSRARQVGKGKAKDNLKKAGDWFKKAAKYIKDNKLISSGLKSAAPYAGPIGGPVAGFLSGVAGQIGYGVILPGDRSQHGNGVLLAGQRRTRKRRPRLMPVPMPMPAPMSHNVFNGSGMHGSGLLLAGQRPYRMSGNGKKPHRNKNASRIFKPVGVHITVGKSPARIIGNRIY
jgi:hypothetical protein